MNFKFGKFIAWTEVFSINKRILQMNNYNGPNLKFIEEQHPEFLDFARKFNDDGYVIINLQLKTDFLTSIINDLKNILSDKNLKRIQTIITIMNRLELSKHGNFLLV